MEVHHHSHNPAEPHHKKNWKSYFWEFLMLFLAVFCGFLAEYQLEHVIEKQREKEYIVSLKEDLCEDTTIYNNNNIRNHNIIASEDTLRKLIQSGSKDIVKMYELNITSLAGIGTVYTDRTSSQLKNSGAMRLIRNKKVADAVMRCWALQSFVVTIQDDAKALRIRAREQSYMIFDNKYYSDSLVNGKRKVAENAVLLTNNYNDIAEFGNRVSHLKNLLQFSYLTSIKNLRVATDSLISLINKEYHVD